jgi:hypothetical protein
MTKDWPKNVTSVRVNLKAKSQKIKTFILIFS